MADSKVTIKIDADAEGAKRAFAEVQSSADAAMESGARSAQKLSKSLDNVAESAKLTNQQIKALTTGLAGAAVGIAAVALKDYGMDKEASYLSAAGSKAMQWGSMGAMAGGFYGMIGGATAGAAVGAIQNHFERDRIGKEQAEGVGDTVESLAKAREEMDRVAERTDNFEKLLKTLGDTTADAASREKLLADEIEKRKQGEDGAREKMKAAEAAIKSFQGTLDGPMTRDQEKYFQTLQDDWKNAAKELQTNRAERKTLEGQKIDKDKPSYDAAGTNAERFGSLLSGLEKAGIGFAALETNALAAKHAKGWGFVSDYYEGGPGDASTKVADNTAKANDIAEKSLAVLESIDAKTTGDAPTAVFA